MLAKIAKFLLSEENRNSLLQAEDEAEVYGIINKEFNKT
ncbi:MAG: PTS sugar transporter subunit IIA, partial [bacterium]|nr:PTS sugar transporter subunit IIA [bacterium]